MAIFTTMSRRRSFAWAGRRSGREKSSCSEHPPEKGGISASAVRRLAGQCAEILTGAGKHSEARAMAEQALAIWRMSSILPDRKSGTR